MLGYDYYVLGLKKSISSTGATTEVSARQSRFTMSVTGGTTSSDFVNATSMQFNKSERVYRNGIDVSLGRFGSCASGYTYQGPYGTYGIIDSAYLVSHPSNGMLEGRSKAERQALDKAFEKLTSQLNLAVDLLEISETTRMIANLKDLRYWAKTLRESFDEHGWKHASTHEISNRWLEYRYGWQPLLSSIYGIVDVARKRTRVPLRVIARSSVTDNQKVVAGSYTYESPYVLKETQWTARCEVSMVFGDSGTSVDSIYDYTSLDPAVIGWELVPYSFVIDWIYDIGGYLSHLETHARFRSGFVRGYRTVTSIIRTVETTEGHSTYSLMPTAPCGLVFGTYERQKSWSTSLTEKFKDRLKYSSCPRPVKPVLDVKINSKHLADSAALIAQLWKR